MDERLQQGAKEEAFSWSPKNILISEKAPAFHFVDGQDEWINEVQNRRGPAVSNALARSQEEGVPVP